MPELQQQVTKNRQSETPVEQVMKICGVNQEDASRLLWCVSGYPYCSIERALLFCRLAMERGGGDVEVALEWFETAYMELLAELDGG